MIPSLAGLGLYLKASSQNQPNDQKIWAVALAMPLSFNAFFSIGLGPITWVYSLEIFWPNSRSQCSSIAVAVNMLTSWVMSLTFLYTTGNTVRWTAWERWGFRKRGPRGTIITVTNGDSEISTFGRRVMVGMDGTNLQECHLPTLSAFHVEISTFGQN
ncbi:hypothetical protein TIFTF001_002499 [Ficus carica]|uniref:Uncharacterized protein n=1 Tax=Ficus carica TaxID=3494 RepID=A0AA87ZN61_FICCA|nr:hypothetical protein TIFTF001_002499 [Ficus carica]